MAKPTKFKLPHKLNIYGMSVEIKTIKNLQDDYGYAGQFCTRNKTIELDNKLEDSELVQTLIHEVLHAIAYRIRLSEAIHKDVEEIVVDSFAQWIEENLIIKFK